MCSAFNEEIKIKRYDLYTKVISYENRTFLKRIYVIMPEVIRMMAGGCFFEGVQLFFLKREVCLKPS